MIRARTTQLREATRRSGHDLQLRYILSALYPRGAIPPNAHANLMNKLKNMGF